MASFICYPGLPYVIYDRIGPVSKSHDKSQVRMRIVTVDLHVIVQ